ALLVGAGFVVGIMLAPAVVWIITPDEILIGQERPFGKLRTRIVAKGDIAELQVRGDRGHPERFAIFLKLASGDQLTSPRIAEITRTNETSRRIAELLGTSLTVPPANPLDATNAEIRIGDPVRKSGREEVRMGILVFASLYTILYAYMLWKDSSPSLPTVILPLIGYVVAFLLFQSAHRFAGESWIVRHGEILIERISRSGELSADAITDRDIESIFVNQPDEGSCSVAVNLRSGKTMHSPNIGTETETQAVSDEIVRRLGIAPEKVRR
ncbi:hypothetical protein CO669_34820, partial [Bradyrhizobium sp. Y36]|uniref:hypothetical protein n=1 Tax=Bradyrhizobium sp. Y36 TaxID=2035447 RepID=UPI000BE7CD0A